MQPTAIEAAAEFLIAVRRGQRARTAAFPPELAPTSEPAAYAIQQAVLRQLGARVGGWKASAFDADHGLSAPLIDGTIWSSPAHLSPRAAPTRDTTMFGVEPEIAFRLHRDLPPRSAAPYDRATVMDAIGEAFAAIEICVSRFVDHAAAPPHDRLADAIINEGLVIGAARSAWQSLDLTRLALRVSIDGQCAHEGVGGHPLGDPLVSLLWIANHLSGRGIGLRAGEIVTTGSCNGIRFVPTGHSVLVEFGGLGAAMIDF